MNAAGEIVYLPAVKSGDIRTRLRAEVVIVARLSLPAASLTRQSAEHRTRRRAAAEPNTKSDLLGTRSGRADVQM